jgi:hypothetical protein
MPVLYQGRALPAMVAPRYLTMAALAHGRSVLPRLRREYGEISAPHKMFPLSPPRPSVRPGARRFLEISRRAILSHARCRPFRTKAAIAGEPVRAAQAPAFARWR